MLIKINGWHWHVVYKFAYKFAYLLLNCYEKKDLLKPALKISFKFIFMVLGAHTYCAECKCS